MNKNLIVTVIVVIFIALAGGAYFMNQRNASQAPAQTETQDSSEPQASASIEKISLKNIMAMSGDQQCQFSDPETGSNGVSYISGGKMRGDFNTKAGDKETVSHMINDGKDVYIWMDDQATGFKTSLQAIEEMSNTEGMTGVNQTVDLNKEVEYKCTSWTPDPVQFAVPAEVRFQDMTTMMNDAMRMIPSGGPNSSALPAGNAQACAACDNLEGDAQTQCKRALKCN